MVAGGRGPVPRRVVYQLLEAPPPPELPPPPEKPPPPPEKPPPLQLPPPEDGVMTQPCCLRNFVPSGLFKNARRIGNRISHPPPITTPPQGGNPTEGQIA